MQLYVVVIDIEEASVVFMAKLQDAHESISELDDFADAIEKDVSSYRIEIVRSIHQLFDYMYDRG